jgi:GWxTD domain-containing protein
MKATRFALLVLLVSIAATLSAALSKSLADFAKGPAQFLMTKEEQAAWKQVDTDEKAELFITLFWARRDPTPATPVNEFRNAIEERVRSADTTFKWAGGVGSATDRGKVFVLMGSPTKLIKAGPREPASTTQVPLSSSADFEAAPRLDGVQPYSSKEVWEYEQGKTSMKLGQPVAQIMFIDQYGDNNWKLDKTPTTDAAALFDRVARSYLVLPDLTEAPVYATAAPARAVGVFKTDALREAVEAARASKAPSRGALFVSSGEFITAKGEPFVALQLYVPKTASLTPSGTLTMFGMIEHATSGEPALIFEESVTAKATTGGVVVSRALALPPAQYKGTIGLAQGGRPIDLVSTEIAVAGVEREEPGISGLILSNHVFAMESAQDPMEPFAFGGLKVVPKSDAAFRVTDDLWYFVELRNPGIDAANNEPKVTVKLALTGKTGSGKPVTMTAPAEVTPAQEVKGVPGHWGVGQSIPLASFEPGDYTLAVKITDLVGQRSWSLQSSFRIVE